MWESGDDLPEGGQAGSEARGLWGPMEVSGMVSGVITQQTSV